MDSATLQNRIWKGYGKAALRIGPAFNQFRPNSATNPFGSGPIATLNASFNAEDMTYGKPSKYGKPMWYCLVDGTQTQVGDYLSNTDKTYYIAAMQQTLPILAVECNRTINVVQAAQQPTVGAVGYGGDTAAGEILLMKQWPASILQGTKGEKGDVNLPGDVRNPWWIVLLPAYPGVTIRSAHIITDDLSRRYVISSAELTDLGWRCTAMQAQT
ncbi:MAG TPA: hypothetical protein VF783_14130 [Terriglobales bacterium]